MQYNMHVYVYYILAFYSHELPEVQATIDLNNILCNGDLSEAESEDDSKPAGTSCNIIIILNLQLFIFRSCTYSIYMSWSEYYIAELDHIEKSEFQLIPDFKQVEDSEADEIVFKFGSIQSDWEQDATKLAWRKSDLRDDQYNCSMGDA